MKIRLVSAYAISFLLVVTGVFTAPPSHARGLHQAVRKIRKIPYNPRPYLANIAEMDLAAARQDFLQTFGRVTFCAPANGKTYAPGNSLTGTCEDPDVLLVGYLYKQAEPGRPGIILTHGSVGPTLDVTSGELVFGPWTSSISRSYGVPVQMALTFRDNGYNVLAFDRRDGLLTVCSKEMSDTPGHPCQALYPEFRDDIPASFVPQTRGSDIAAHAEGDVVAAATFFQRRIGQHAPLGAYGGSRGGQSFLVAAGRQHSGGFSPELNARVKAFFLVSPVSSQDHRLGESLGEGIDRICRAAQAYSEEDDPGSTVPPVSGSGIGTVSPSDISGIQDLLDLTRAIDALGETRDPILILDTLNDYDVTPEEGFVFRQKTARMPNAETLTLATGGHNNLMFWTDPFFVEKATLVFFKTMLAPHNRKITAIPNVESSDPNARNHYWVSLPLIPPKQADRILFRSVTQEIGDQIKATCFGP